MRFGTLASLLVTTAAMAPVHPARLIAQAGARTELAIDAAPVWFEESGASARVSPDGRWGAYRGLALQLYDLRTHRQTREPIWPGLDAVQWIAFESDGEVFLRGTLGGRPGWFRRGPSGPIRLTLPADADPRWSADGSRVAYVRASMRDSGLFAGSLDEVRSYHVGGAVTGVAWTASRDTLVAVAVDTTGVSSLYRIDLVRGGASLIVGHLDGVTITPSSIAVTPDGRRAFVPLAGANAPVDADRHRPSAARRLSIYEIDLSNGRMRVVANAEPGADLLAPAIANGRLYWTRAETRASVVTLPARGGPVRTLVTDAALPSWRPDGKEIGLYYGDWRVVDWAINWDAGVIPVGARGVATGPRSSLITNFGEDFEPEWSPRGTWIAYHSHRSPGPVPYYGASGSSDDIWLRRIGAPPRDTADIRLTDFGAETGPPSWSRDGTRLIFVSYDRRGVPGQSLLWLVTIDTVTGKPLGHSRVPLPPGVQSISWAAWSPVKDVIAIEAEGERGNHTIWLMSPDSAHARQLVRFPMRTFGGLAWTPNGKTLVYSALVGKYDQLFAVNVTGGKPRRLTRAAAQILHPSVSPNGLVIAATRLEHRKSIVSAPLPLAVKTSAEVRARARRRTTR